VPFETLVQGVLHVISLCALPCLMSYDSRVSVWLASRLTLGPALRYMHSWTTRQGRG